MDRYDPYTDKFLRDTQYDILGTNLAEVGTDLISRQAAIDALGEDPKYKARIFKTYKEGRSDQWFDDVAKILAIPSAQPEIIVCEDCKWRISENRKNTSLWLPCRALVTPDQFSCIYAERREMTT